MRANIVLILMFVLFLGLGWQSAAARAEGSVEGRKVALLICNGLYGEPNGNLPYAVPDCRAMEKLLSAQGFETNMYLNLPLGEMVKLLGPSGAGPQNRNSFLDTLAQGDIRTLVFYYSGHGQSGLKANAKSDSDTESYLIPTNNAGGAPYVESYPISKLREHLQAVGAEETIVLIDSCFPAENAGAKGIGLSINAAAFPKSTWLFSAGPGQLSYTSDTYGHSVFTHYVVEGMRNGRGATRSGYVTASSLHRYVSREVATYVSDNHNKSQRPILQGDGDVVLASGVYTPTPTPSPLPTATPRMDYRGAEVLDRNMVIVVEHAGKLTIYGDSQKIIREMTVSEASLHKWKAGAYKEYTFELQATNGRTYKHNKYVTPHDMVQEDGSEKRSFAPIEIFLGENSQVQLSRPGSAANNAGQPNAANVPVVAGGPQIACEPKEDYGRFQLYGNAVVVDTQNRLAWLRKNTSPPLSYREAELAAKALEICSLTEWRLPTEEELMTIWDQNQKSSMRQHGPCEGGVPGDVGLPPPFAVSCPIVWMKALEREELRAFDLGNARTITVIPKSRGGNRYEHIFIAVHSFP